VRVAFEKFIGCVLPENHVMMKPLLPLKPLTSRSTLSACPIVCLLPSPPIGFIKISQHAIPKSGAPPSPEASSGRLAPLIRDATPHQNLPTHTDSSHSASGLPLTPSFCSQLLPHPSPNIYFLIIPPLPCIRFLPYSFTCLLIFRVSFIIYWNTNITSEMGSCVSHLKKEMAAPPQNNGNWNSLSPQRPETYVPHQQQKVQRVRVPSNANGAQMRRMETESGIPGLTYDHAGRPV